MDNILVDTRNIVVAGKVIPVAADWKITDSPELREVYRKIMKRPLFYLPHDWQMIASVMKDTVGVGNWTVIAKEFMRLPKREIRKVLSQVLKKYEVHTNDIPVYYLPDGFECDGIIVRIKTDTKSWLDFDRRRKNPNPDNIRRIVFDLLAVKNPITDTYGREVMIDDAQAQLIHDKMTAFFYGKTEIEVSEESTPAIKKKKTFDYTIDWAPICAAFKQVYGVDLTKDELHWWQFQWWFGNLPTGNNFMDYWVALSQINVAKLDKKTPEQQKYAKAVSKVQSRFKGGVVSRPERGKPWWFKDKVSEDGDE